MRADKKPGKSLWAAFILYLLFMVFLLFGMRYLRTGGIWRPQPEDYWEQVRHSTNLIPFRTIRNYLSRIDRFSPGDLAFRNVAGNVLLFIPFGWFLPRLVSAFHDFFDFLIACGILLVSVELGQVFTLLGSCDIDDLILNLGGNVIGYLIWAVGYGIAKVKQKKRTAA